MDKLVIFSGSRKRLSLPLLRWCAKPTILVEPQELESYRNAHPSQDIQSLPDNNRGFSFLMNQMVQRTLALDCRYFVFTDDDVTGVKIRSSLQEKFYSPAPEIVEKALQNCINYASKKSLAQLALSFSGQSWSAKKSIDSTVGAWGVHITDAKAVSRVGGFDETLAVFGDWDMSARLILGGYETERTNLFSFVHKMKSMEGGAADIYARKELVKDAAERVVRKFGSEVSRVKYVESHGLHEVRFNWKKLGERRDRRT